MSGVESPRRYVKSIEKFHHRLQVPENDDFPVTGQSAEIQNNIRNMTIYFNHFPAKICDSIKNTTQIHSIKLY